MKLIRQGIKEITLQALAKSFFQESYTYGFSLSDYLRFINILLDFALNDKGEKVPKEKSINRPKDLKIDSLPLKGGRLIIRDLEASKDLLILNSWFADEYGQYFLFSPIMDRIIALNEFIEKEKNIIGIICLSDYTPIGCIAFMDYDPKINRAELRKLIGEPKMRGMGFCTEATQLWIQYGLTSLNLNKIYLNSLDTDIRTIKLNEELGFKVEGILRNEIFFNGRYHDILRMAFCKD